MQIAKCSHVGDKLAYSICPVLFAEIKFCKKYFWASYEMVLAVCVLSRQQLNFVCFTCLGQMRRQKSDPFSKMEKMCNLVCLQKKQF